MNARSKTSKIHAFGEAPGWIPPRWISGCGITLVSKGDGKFTSIFSSASTEFSEVAGATLVDPARDLCRTCFQ